MKKYIENMIDRYKRLDENSLDPDNRKKYEDKVEQLEGKLSSTSKEESKSLSTTWKPNTETFVFDGVEQKPDELKKLHEENKKKELVNNIQGDIIKNYRSGGNEREELKFISDEEFDRLTITAKKKGAVILRGTKEVEEHLNKMKAAASNIGDILMFRNEVCISEVLEETYHFEQNISKMNNDKSEPLR